MADRLPPLTLTDLTNAGFVHNATWRADKDGGLNLVNLDCKIPESPGIYLFVVAEVVKYIGVAREGLADRLGQYGTRIRRGNRLRMVHKGIKEHSSSGSIHLYTLVVSPRWDVGWLPIDRLIGLESGLIEAIDPAWNPFNRAGRHRRAILQAELESLDGARPSEHPKLSGDEPNQDADAPLLPTGSELLDVMEESERDVEAGLTVSLEEVLAELDDSLGRMEARRRARRA
jgi:hypothetical protein